MKNLVLNQLASFLSTYGGMLAAAIVGVLLVAACVIALLRRSRQKHEAAEAMLRHTNRVLEDEYRKREARALSRVQELEQRANQLQIAATVACDTAMIHDVQELMTTMAEAVSNGFGFYHTGVFLIDESGNYAVLRAASSAGGQHMVARGHRLRVGREGVVGYVADRGQARMAFDVAADSVWRRTEELSRTRSEAALPLKVADQIIGVLDVQSEEPGAFGQSDIEILSIVADQLALAIHNARLLAESRRAIAQLEATFEAQMATLWGRTMERTYRYDGFDLERVVDNAESEQEMADDGNLLVVPLVLRGQCVGTMTLEREAEDALWTDEERVLAERMGIQAGLSLETARLLQENQRRTRREQALSDIAGRMRETLDMELVVQTALREIGQNLGLSNIEIRIGADDGS